jgi:hypothetical protein
VTAGQLAAFTVLTTRTAPINYLFLPKGPFSLDRLNLQSRGVCAARALFTLFVSLLFSVPAISSSVAFQCRRRLQVKLALAVAKGYCAAKPNAIIEGSLRVDIPACTLYAPRLLSPLRHLDEAKHGS